MSYDARIRPTAKLQPSRNKWTRYVTLDGPITPDDLIAELGRPAKVPNGVSVLKRMRNSHHDLAMKVADGYSNIECAALTGYAPGTVSALREDPAFKELVRHYTDKKERAYLDMHERLASLAEDTIETLHDKVREEELTAGQLIEISKMALDRSGHGPQSKSTNVNLNGTVPAEMLLRIKSAAVQRGEVRKIGSKPLPAIDAQAIVPQNQGGAISGPAGSVPVGAPQVHSQKEEPAGSAGQGDGISKTNPTKAA